MKSDAVTSYTMFPHSLRPLPQPCAKEQVCAVSTMPCPAHVVKFSCAKYIIIIVSVTIIIMSQTSQRGPHVSSLHTGGNLRVPDWDSRVDEVTLSNKIL